MFTSEYTPLATNTDDDCPTNSDAKKKFFRSYLPAIFIACLSIVNVSLLPFSFFSSTTVSLADLPYPEKHLGLDRAAKSMPVVPTYTYAWPDGIARLSQKLKNAVYGNGSQVFISVEDTTLMRFPVPPAIHNGTLSSPCAILWTPPPTLGPRQYDLELKGDVSEIEVWSVIAPKPVIHHPPSDANFASPHPDGDSLNKLDFDSLSWNTRPVTGELLGTLDLTARPNATTIEFSCPQAQDTLVVELRCIRVACHVQFMQVPFVPKMGFELVRRN